MSSLLLDGDLIAATRLTARELCSRPQYPAPASFECSTSGTRSHDFSGPLLHDVIVYAAAGAVPAPRKDRARFLVAVTGLDGHQAVLSWAEIDPEFARRPVLLALRRDGVALERNGPQLVVPSDRCGSRFVSTVSHIWVGVREIPSGVRKQEPGPYSRVAP